MMDAVMEGYPAAQEQTMETVWQLCRERMWQQAWKILGNRADAEDAVMDAMVRIGKNMPKFRYLEDGELIALSLTYVRRTAIDIYNRKKQEPVPVEEILENDKVSLEDPLNFTLGQDLEDMVYRLLREMPESMRDVLNLHVHYDMSVTEIADALQITAGTVRTRLSRGRKWLREKLKEEGVEVYG